MASIKTILSNMSSEYSKTVDALTGCLPQIERVAEAMAECRQSGGNVILFEDDNAAHDFNAAQMGSNDFLFIISPSGSNNNLLSLLRTASRRGLTTACLTFNPASVITDVVMFSIVPLIGPVRNPGTESLTIQLVKEMLEKSVSGVDAEVGAAVKQADALMEKGINAVMIEAGISDYNLAKQLLLKYGSVHKAVESLKNV